MVRPDTQISVNGRRSATKLEWYDPARGDSAFRLQPLDTGRLRSASRVNYFTILWARTGSGIWHVDSKCCAFESPSLLFASPYQTTFLEADARTAGAHLLFHANFFCIERHHQEVGCNGVLFNDIYGSPVLHLMKDSAADFARLIELMGDELASAGLAHGEVLLSYLKVLLIKATRLKLEQGRAVPAEVRSRPDILARLIELVEIHYREKHRPSDYAKLLGISGKALNKIVRTHFGKTLTLLIRERVLMHAKWQLLHTRKSVKEVADETGFTDEFYFSRLFKRATGMAPTAFREFETRIRGGRNLSM